MERLVNNVEQGHERICKELLASLKNIKFGQIVLTVHNGKIVQIDKTEKIRLNEIHCESGGGI
jgi:hypothetical protein